MNAKYIGLCDTINWQELIDHIATQEGEVRTYGVDFYQNKDGRFDEIISLWNQAGYDKTGTVEWYNYYPGKHFNTSIIEQFENWSNTKCARAWISKVNPGRYAPYHIDIDDNEEEYLKQGELVRLCAFPAVSSKGQVVIVDETVFHLEEQGAVYEWPHYRAWHAGGNCSFKPKYLFNFLGVRK